MFRFELLKTWVRTRPSAAAQRNRSLMRHIVKRVDLNRGGEGDCPRRFVIRQSIQQLQEVYGPVPHPPKGGAV